MKKAKILYVEDDINLSFVTKDNLEIKGYDIIFCKDGLEALQKYDATFDLCILDVMLPQLDGFTVAQKIREQNKEIPIIFLTAKSTTEDKIYGLKLGADDYITKPFSIQELHLKIEIFLKRSKFITTKYDNQNILKLGKYTFDKKNFLLKYDQKFKKLTYKESELLSIFIENQNTILKREEILFKIWKNDSYFNGRSLDVFISRLRKYLKKDENIKIENIHGIGFRMQTKLF